MWRRLSDRWRLKAVDVRGATGTTRWGRVRCVNDAELFVLARVLKTEPGGLFPRDVAVIISALSG